ncbi:MAG: GtrA family protein [Clostridia bacterium]|nr:GtrA family protein [Clostridia bacterium]
MNKLKDLIKKIINKETIMYIIFGVLTTVVNFIAFKLFDLLLGVKLYLITNVIAWVIAVAFAYITNKLFVFESKSWAPSVIRREIPSFVAARLFSLGVEEVGLIFFVSLLKFGEKSFMIPLINFEISGTMAAKLILAVVVVILNYFFSKLIIFRKKQK